MFSCEAYADDWVERLRKILAGSAKESLWAVFWDNVLKLEKIPFSPEKCLIAVKIKCC